MVRSGAVLRLGRPDLHHHHRFGHQPHQPRFRALPLLRDQPRRLLCLCGQPLRRHRAPVTADRNHNRATKRDVMTAIAAMIATGATTPALQ